MNTKRTDWKRQRARGRPPARKRGVITVVCGPPGSGKSTWVREQMRRGDLVVDLDSLMSALTGLPHHDKPESVLPLAFEARDSLVNRLARDGSPGAAWIIAMAAKPVHRQAIAERVEGKIVVFETAAEVCKQRVVGRPDGRDWPRLIDEWWAQYERGRNEAIMTWAASLVAGRLGRSTTRQGVFSLRVADL